MIIVQLIGGLGNQMFQYATARRISHVNNAHMKLDTGWFDTLSPNTNRKYELNVFNIREDFASSEEIRRLRGPGPEEKSSLLCRLRRMFFSQDKHSHAREKHFHFDPDILRLKDNVYLDGYWQSANYFDDIRDLLIEEFSIKTSPDALNKKMADEIRSSESVSIHVRRGDYISNPATNQYHGTCSLDYYYAAIKIISEKIKNPHFFLFSDDPEWVKENLKLDYPATCVDFNSPERAYEDMRLLSLCSHHIIANSSFSWWGAWLSQNPNKIVIAPSKWFNAPSINTKDLLPDSWIKI